jgi:hypothetical protein
MFNPWFLIGVALALAGVFEYGHHQGYSECKQEEALAIASKNQELQDSKEKSNVELKLAQNQLTKSQAETRTAIANGQRLYVRLAPQSTDTTTGNGQATAQLDAKFAQSIVDITDRGDQAIVQLNSCIDQYEQIREIVNARR